MITDPSSPSIRETVDFPDAMPPVNPTMRCLTLPPLTPGAIRRSPSRDAHALEDRTAPHARSAVPAVYLQALTVRARRAIALDVIPDGRPPESDCFAQDVFDGTVQAPNLFVRQRTGRAIRSDTGAKKCLVGVNVPESRDAL